MKWGEVGGVAPAVGITSGSEGGPPMWIQRGTHAHRNIKGGKHVDYVVEEQAVPGKSQTFSS